MSRLEQLLGKYHQAAGGASPEISYKHAEDLLRQARFDGPVTVHWRGGVPRVIDLGKHQKISLTVKPA